MSTITNNKLTELFKTLESRFPVPSSTSHSITFDRENERIQLNVYIQMPEDENDRIQPVWTTENEFDDETGKQIGEKIADLIDTKMTHNE